MEKFTKFGVFVSLVFALICVGSESLSAQTNTLITSNSVGSIRIGMTVAAARRAMRGFTFKRSTDGDGVALIEVKRRNRVHMTVYAGEFDVDKPINEKGIIEFIEVWDSRYRTSNGVYSRMLVSQVERKFGKLVSINRSEIEAREFATFANQPKGIDFRLQNRKGMAGVYPSGQSTTTRYSPLAYVFSVVVIGNGSAPLEETNPKLFSSRYTDLRTQCEIPAGQGEEGGHVSTYCSGYGGYRIHMFDTANTMEINVESKDPNRSVHLASQSLAFNRNNRKVEWRFRDGKPFAVIMRAYKYQRVDGLIKYPVRRTGEILVVKGLPGYERINQAINVKSVANPNAKAREVADLGYDNKGGSNGGSGADFQNVNVNQFNRIIDIGVRGKKEWVKSPMEVTVKLVGEFQEVKSRTIEFLSPSAEGSDRITVTVKDEGMLDDSISGEKLVLKMRRNPSGVWKVLSGQRSWKCWQGRGHQNYSAVPCV